VSVKVKQLLLPVGRLPDDPVERRARLDHYFDDLLASVKAVQDGWEIDLNWPSTADYYVDPALGQGLEWWSGSAKVDQIHTQVCHSSRGQLSLNDSWTLYSWSRWLADCRARKKAVEEVVVLHVDDHTDLMTPRLTFQGAGLCDAISGRAFDLYEPESVRSAIQTGAVGVGSFISPFIHAIKRVHVRHLCQTASDRCALGCSLVAEHLADTLLNVGGSRPAVRVTTAELGVSGDPGAHVAGQYHCTRQLDRWLDELPDAPVLLHFDMDYFNNRYNRDSDWAAKERRHDPDLSAVLAAIDAVFEQVRQARVASRIENVAVGISPGFFPAELWAHSIERMQEHLALMGWEIKTPER
jgi:hypothetical protein